MSKIDLLLLGLLSEGSRHGYDLLQEIERREMDQWIGVSTQGVYKGLARLETRGLLELRTVSGDSHPDRNVYAITPAGRDRFRELAHRSLGELSKPFFPVLWGVGFMHLLDQADFLAQLEARKEQLKGARRDLENYRHRHEEMGGTLQADAITEYYHDLVEMELAWLARLVRRVKRIKNWPEGVCS